MIKLRLDVDYPYPSRLRSFLATTLALPPTKGYLKNSKIIAKMVNESLEEVEAYWFFTPYTTPDRELLALLNPGRHEVALHVATDAESEWKRVEKATGRQVSYYTVHGTARLAARLMWRRGIRQARAPIPQGFPLKSFYDFPTLQLDWLCYRNPPTLAVPFAQRRIAKGEVMHIHPEWLFQKGTLNRRGPYYETLKSLLNVDQDLNSLSIQKKGLFKIAKFIEEYEYLKDAPRSADFIQKLIDRDVDLYTFLERKWCCPLPDVPRSWSRETDNVALLQIVKYEDWLAKVGKKTRNMIRKAEKSGVKVEVVAPSDKLAEGIWRIFNETPIRQGRAFTHYGWSLERVKTMMTWHIYESTYAGAYLNGELVGFIQIAYGDRVAVMTQILSLQRHWDKALNNALVAKAVEVCAAKNVPWLMYGRIGNHPSLDTFKESNGFSKFPLTRYYVPLTGKGRAGAKLGLNRKTKDALPQWLKGRLIPLFNWLSRTKTQVRGKLRRQNLI